MEQVMLYLMNQKGFEVLKSIISHGMSEHIKYVVTSEDKNVKKDWYHEICEISKENGIDVLKKEESATSFDGYKFAVGWRWIIEDYTNLIVLHDSLLPKYRGFSPLVNMLIHGEEKIGVTALFATEFFDSGDIIIQKSKKIAYPIKIAKAINEIAVLYSEIIYEILIKIIQDEELKSYKQEEQNATYSMWRDYNDYFIDWNQSADEIERFINAVGYPYDGAKTLLDGKEIAILDVKVIKTGKVLGSNVEGKILYQNNGNPVVACGIDCIEIVNALSKDKKFTLDKLKQRFVVPK